MKECTGWRVPPRVWRAVLVAVTLAAPGVVFGGIVGLLLGAVPLGAAAGGLLAATLGAWMESSPGHQPRSGDNPNAKRPNAKR